MGAFITFEGIEGCGKSTQIKLLMESMSQSGIQVVLTREPGGTVIGKKIRDILLDPRNSEISSEAELLLYASDRAQHVREIIMPAVRNGHVVLCDRFTDATTAYQGYGRGLDLSLIKELNRIATYGIHPDLTILLDCPVETGLTRAIERNSRSGVSHDDRFEKEEFDFHCRVRDGYLTIARLEPERFAVVDAAGDVSSIHAEIKRVVTRNVVF